jgi:acyl-CoA thioesterase FadM
MLCVLGFPGVCLTNDVDTLLYHMNNARYLRELDFARVDFYERSGLYRTIKSKGGAVVQGACTVRYRRFLRPFSIYKIYSKVRNMQFAYTLYLFIKNIWEKPVIK